MRITFDNVIDKIMAADGIRATLSAVSPDNLRVINADLSDAIRKFIPDAAEWICYVCPNISIAEKDEESVTFSMANTKLSTRYSLMTSFLAWRVLHQIFGMENDRTATFCRETCEAFAEILNSCGAPGDRIPRRRKHWY